MSESILPTVKPQILRDKKGRIVKAIAQDTNINGTAGCPCNFCENKDKYLEITKNYFEECQNEEKNNRKYPSIAELAGKMGVWRQRISEWEDKKLDNGELEHPEFSDYIKKLKNLQFFRLEIKLQGRYNVTGAIFLMKTQQGQIETEKRVLQGDNGEPIKYEIEIVEDKPTNE